MALRRQSLLDYYLARLSRKQLSVDGTFRRAKTGPGRDPLKHFEDKIAERDYLIVVFPFVSAREFPVLMSSLQRRYSLAFSQLGRGGHGELVFRSRPEASGGEPGQGSVGPPDR